MSPTRKQKPQSLSTSDVEETEWYVAGEAAKKLAENSKRDVPVSYVSKLAALGKIRTKKVHDRLTLYSKTDIDDYKVEPRGKKSGTAARERSKK
jgi:hypothetical protein